MSIGAAQRELSRSVVEHFFSRARLRLHPVRGLASPLQRHGGTQRRSLLAQGWRRCVVAIRARVRMGYILVRFLDDQGPTKLPLSSARYATSTGAVHSVTNSTFARGGSVA